MLKYLIYRFQLRKLFLRRRKNTRLYYKLRKKVKDKNPNHDEIQILLSEERSETDIIDYEIETITTSYYLQLAHYRFIEIPEYNNSELWVESSLDPNRKVLSNKAINILRNAIRDERNARVDIIIKIITTVTGLVGALIGLFAIIRK